MSFYHSFSESESVTQKNQTTIRDFKVVTLGYLLAFALAFATQSASAQEQNTIDQAVEATCNAFLAPMLGRKEIATLAMARSIDSRTVCSCARKNVYNDKRLSELLTKPDEEIVRVTDAPPVRTYVLGRMMQSVLLCFSQELDATLSASTVLK